MCASYAALPALARRRANASVLATIIAAAALDASTGLAQRRRGFDALASGARAAPAPAPANLLAPLLDRCDAGSEFDQRRCRQSRSARQRDALRGVYASNYNPGLVTLSPYDFATHGFRLTVRGVSSGPIVRRGADEYGFLSSSPSRAGVFPERSVHEGFVTIRDTAVAEQWRSLHAGHLAVRVLFRIGAAWTDVRPGRFSVWNPRARRNAIVAGRRYGWLQQVVGVQVFDSVNDEQLLTWPPNPPPIAEDDSNASCERANRRDIRQRNPHISARALEQEVSAACSAFYGDDMDTGEAPTSEDEPAPTPEGSSPPPPQRSPAAGSPAPDAPETCNGRDDDGDELVDEELVYVPIAGTQHTTPAGAAGGGLWWATRGQGRIAISWKEGPGTPSDVLHLQLIDDEGTPIGSTLSSSAFQPSDWNAPVWTDDRFYFVGATRGYACTSPDCVTFGAAILSNGHFASTPSEIFRGESPGFTAFSAGSSRVWLLAPSSSGTTARVRSVAPSGEVTADRSLWSTAEGERIGGVTAAAAPDGGVDWIYVSRVGSATSLRLVPMTAAGIASSPPVTLAADAAITNDRGGRQVISGPSGIVAVYASSGGASLARWTAAGTPIGSPLPLWNARASCEIDSTASQVYVLCQSEGAIRFWRFSPTLTLLQGPTAVTTGLAATGGSSVVATDRGAMIISSSETSSVTWQRLGCPPLP
ncbi:MAG: hypothetical protein WCJ30_00695 [Deltaproteobacteria bacterium]